MARTRPRAVVSPSPQPETLVAAGTRVSGTPSPTSMSGRGGAPWQEECWRHYNICGEYRYAVNWIGALLSRAVLFATVIENGRPKPLKDGPAIEIVDALFDGPEGKAQMLHQIGVHFTVAGECYLVGYEQDGADEWDIVSAGEMKKQGGRWKVGKVELPTDALVIRLWRPHPRNHGEADSPSRAVLPILAEIERLTQHVAAQVDSRLASAGILMLPKEITFPLVDADGEDTTNTGLSDADNFMAYLTKAMQTAIRNRDSAEAIVPITVMVPAEFLGKAEHLTFWTELDAQAIELRKEAIRRLALGMDMPAEVLTGLAEANHWSAWAVDESAIKSHTEPLLALITTSLARGYLRPLLTDPKTAMTKEEARTYGIAADTSEMRLRPNRSKEALELYDRGELDGIALRRETGFGDDDDLSKKEIKRWVLLQMVTGRTSASPEQIAWALGELGLEGVPVPSTDQPDPMPEPSLEDHPEREIPDPPPSEAALLAASEVLVFRALERAGNKFRSHRVVQKDDSTAADAYLLARDHKLSADFLLEGAWECVARTTEHLCSDTEALTLALDTYARHLLGARVPHDRNRLASFLTLVDN